MTEDEAKTKWCPFARTLTILPDGTPFPPANRLSVADTIDTTGDPLSPMACRCIGSACMAWRSRESAAFTAKANAEFQRTGRRLSPSGTESTGYCGLAGQPA